MLNFILMVLSSLLAGLQTQAAMQAEILALRHQLIVLQRSKKKNRLILRPADRWLWIWLSRLWSGWRSALIIVKPATVIAWHHQGFRWYWTWKVRHGRTGRPTLSKETRNLIRTISRDKPPWGCTANSQRTPEARCKYLASIRGQVHGPLPKTAIPNMENVP